MATTRVVTTSFTRLRSRNVLPKADRGHVRAIGKTSKPRSLTRLHSRNVRHETGRSCITDTHKNSKPRNFCECPLYSATNPFRSALYKKRIPQHPLVIERFSRTCVLCKVSCDQFKSQLNFPQFVMTLRCPCHSVERPFCFCHKNRTISNSDTG